MAAVDDVADRLAGASAEDRGVLRSALDDRDSQPDVEIGMPDRATPVRTHGSAVAVLGGVYDRGLADAVCVPHGTKLPGHELRCDFRAVRMASGLVGGETPTAPQA